jgi:hypothetical protein
MDSTGKEDADAGACRPRQDQPNMQLELRTIHNQLFARLTNLTTVCRLQPCGRPTQRAMLERPLSHVLSPELISAAKNRMNTKKDTLQATIESRAEPRLRLA